MEEIVHRVIHKTESDILQMNDWNLDLATGSDILAMILKLSNDEYDFNWLLVRANSKAREKIFSGETR